MAMKKVVKKKKFGLGRGGFGGGASSGSRDTGERPKFVEKVPPCTNGCPNHNLIREALMAVSRAEEKGQSLEDAVAEAWYDFTANSPFPAVCGRVCPHPCEDNCNRKEKDGAVGINSFERYVGDFGLEKKLKPKMYSEEKRSEKIAVVGSGPAGISAAYQLARRGYPVTVFEAFPKAGGMLRYGIPDYRLPQAVLDAEIQRVLDLGVELKVNTAIGKDVPLEQIRKDYHAVFVGIGGHKGRLLRIEGEDASNVFTGTDFLHRINCDESVDIGKKVVVIGGGDTAIDAARVARRLGADVTLLYRRTRTEMPAIEEEIEGALAEGVDIQYLAAPASLKVENGKAVKMVCQRMELGEPDSSGRRRPVPIEGDTFELELTALIAAVSQEPDFTGFDELREGKEWITVGEGQKTKAENVYSGGDNVNLGLVVHAIHHGRLAAEMIHKTVTGEGPVHADGGKVITKDKVRLPFYEEKKRGELQHLPPADALKEMKKEITNTWTSDEALGEAKRCMSCGLCFHCGTCWSYCQDNAIVKPLTKNEPYKFKLEFCKGCKKCVDMCPCGYIEIQ